MRFSARTGWEAGENEWAAAVRAHRTAGRPLVDLTVANPLACGLGPGEQGLGRAAAHVLSPLADAGALRYTPDPLGMRRAREAVAGYYADAGAVVAPDRVCLTTSTSEAYSFLFRLLCDPGDEVLIARPSYPLFDLLAQLDDVVLREFPLRYDPAATTASGAGWSYDLEALAAAITPRTRAVVVVHPNNPTGNYASASERVALRRLCAAHGLALIADEVFLDYPAGRTDGDTERTASFAANSSMASASCLCFVLSGLSKVCALPQMKLSWIVTCGGPEADVTEAMRRLEIVADTFLSVNAPMQFALPQWLAERAPTQRRIRERVAENLAVLDARLRGSLADRLVMEGGWTAVLRVPSHVAEQPFAVAALGRGVLVQPGVMYGLPAARCVVSLLSEPEAWRRGLALLPV